MPRGLASFLVCAVWLACIYFAGLGLYTEGMAMADDFPAYGARINEVLVAGVGARELAQILEPQTGARVRELVSESYLRDAAGGSAPSSLLAGVVGALLD